MGRLYFWERTPVEYEASGYKLCVGMEENFESALSANKEAISNASKNLMESSIRAQDDMPYTCKSNGKSCFQLRKGE